MTTPSTLSFNQLMSNQAAAIQSAWSKFTNFVSGGLVNALAQANSAVGLSLQAQNLKILQQTRAATSVGPDLDSWLADYDFDRILAVASSGSVTFARFTTLTQAVVPLATVVQTGDGSQQFTVTKDVTNSAWSNGLNGYVMAIGTGSVTVPVTANNAGTRGNVSAGAITQITQLVIGVDTVTNAAAFTGPPNSPGVDEESDPAALSRFHLYMAGLSKATESAVEAAIASVQNGLTYKITENEDYDGTPDKGYFYVVLDDGSGAPPSDLLTAVTSAVDAVRGLTARFNIYAPVIEHVTVSMTVVAGPSFSHSVVAPAVRTALENFIDTLPVGATLPWAQLSAIAFSVTGVQNVSLVLLNSGTSDVTVTAQQVIKYSSVVVS